MSRFGGNAIVFGGGKASDSSLPENQDWQNMIQHHSKLIASKLRYVSSYDAFPKHLGTIPKLPPRTVRLGTLKHEFHEIFIQNSFAVESVIYLAPSIFTNVKCFIIKTFSEELPDEIPRYKPSYDYVLDCWLDYENFVYGDFKNNPNYMEMTLLLLFYKMGLVYEDDIYSFTPSKTYMGKRIRAEFVNNLNHILVGLESDTEFGDLLKQNHDV